LYVQEMTIMLWYTIQVLRVVAERISFARWETAESLTICKTSLCHSFCWSSSEQ
jgi:hypothetical protein